MPLNAGCRVNAPFAPALDLPPPFRPVALREVGDAFAHATRIAAEAGAGTLVHVGRFDSQSLPSFWNPRNRYARRGARFTQD